MGQAIADFPEKLRPLFEPHRFKVLYGGRDGGKSWNIARALLVIGASKPIRVLCCREIQESIDQSVFKLLCDQIDRLGLTSHYLVQRSAIFGRDPKTGAMTGTEFTFTGLLHKIQSIKSAEGIDIAWVEEAQVVSFDSWSKLIPTIRKDDSEIWVSFNPELDTDETYKRFVLEPPPSAVVIKMNYSDNPWASRVLAEEREQAKVRNLDSYLNVWEGHCKQALEGAVYADELRIATQEGRICKVPYLSHIPVHVFPDLGYSDNTSLWFVQKVGLTYRLLLTYQNRLKKWSHYLQFIQESGFLIHTVWLPHDGANENVAAEKTPEQQTREANFKCRIIQRGPIKTGIDAARDIFPACYFDEVGCADGLQALRRYVWDTTAKGLSTREPKHDINSHYSDAFRYFAVGFSEPVEPDERAQKVIKKLTRKIELQLPPGGGAWMS